MAPPSATHSTIETSCTVLFHTEKASAVQQEEIMRDLENPDVKVSVGGWHATSREWDMY